MRYIKLFEEYSEDHYNRVLDLYNEKGLEGMTPEEIEYLNSGGNAPLPEYLDSPFVFCVGEDIDKVYEEKGVSIYGTPPNFYNPDYERDVRSVNYKTFVFSNYETIPIDKSDQLLDGVLDACRSSSKNFNLGSYFGYYDQGWVFYSFDEDPPRGIEFWEEFMMAGGFKEWIGDSIGQEVDSYKNANGQDGAAEKSDVDPNPTNEVFKIDLKGKKLSIQNIIKAISTLRGQGKLKGWKDNIDISDKNNYPSCCGDLFDLIYKSSNSTDSVRQEQKDYRKYLEEQEEFNKIYTELIHEPLNKINPWKSFRSEIPQGLSQEEKIDEIRKRIDAHERSLKPFIDKAEIVIKDFERNHPGTRATKGQWIDMGFPEINPAQRKLDVDIAAFLKDCKESGIELPTDLEEIRFKYFGR